MSVRAASRLTAAAFGLAGGLALAGPGAPAIVLQDPAGDAALRRTDVGNDDPIYPGCTLPDLVEVRIGAWAPATIPGCAADPFAGMYVPPYGARLFRVDVVFAGLVNPPGTLGYAGQPFGALAFGPNAVFGFLEIDIDGDRDTGGELGGAAIHRYLANIGRFGRTPTGACVDRTAHDGLDIDGDFFSPPFFERSGTDFSVALCGCHSVTIDTTYAGSISDGDTMFEAGERWVIRGRYFARSGGYAGASGCSGGSGFGLYDPMVRLLFSHDIGVNRTTVSLVYALDMLGASWLTGQSQQGMDFNVANHTSIAEGVYDLIIGAKFRNPTGPTRILVENWAGSQPTDVLDPADWRATAMFGAAYTAPLAYPYAWADTGFGELFGDVNADGAADEGDGELILGAILWHDGAPVMDCGPAYDGTVQICSFASNFMMYDLDGDGDVDKGDIELVDPPTALPGDLDEDGFVDFADLNILLGMFNTSGKGLVADINGDGEVDFSDLNILLGNWGFGPGLRPRPVMSGSPNQAR